MDVGLGRVSGSLRDCHPQAQGVSLVLLAQRLRQTVERTSPQRLHQNVEAS